MRNYPLIFILHLLTWFYRPSSHLRESVTTLSKVIAQYASSLVDFSSILLIYAGFSLRQCYRNKDTDLSFHTISVSSSWDVKREFSDSVIWCYAMLWNEKKLSNPIIVSFMMENWKHYEWFTMQSCNDCDTDFSLFVQFPRTFWCSKLWKLCSKLQLPSSVECSSNKGISLISFYGLRLKKKRLLHFVNSFLRSQSPQLIYHRIEATEIFVIWVHKNQKIIKNYVSLLLFRFLLATCGSLSKSRWSIEKRKITRLWRELTST